MGSGGEKHARLDEMIKAVRLGESKRRLPARAFRRRATTRRFSQSAANHPRLLLLDEPFSRLDETLRERLAKQVRAIIKSQKLTALMVTHNQHEAFMVADIGGVIQQVR